MINPELRHSLSKMSWKIDGIIPKTNVVRYFIVFYCPDCLIGRLSNMTYDRPEGLSTKDLGIKRRDVWPEECPVKVAKKREVKYDKPVYAKSFAGMMGARV